MLKILRRLTPFFSGATTEAGLNVNRVAPPPNSIMPPLPINYIDYDASSAFFASPFLFSTERFPPKYEDALKLPTATPRRASCGTIPFMNLSPPDAPPLYENDEQNGEWLPALFGGFK